MSDQKKSGLSRLIPILKIAVAVGLIGFLLWLVPIQDEIHLKDASGEIVRKIVGTIEEQTEDRAVFVADDGTRYVLELEDDQVTSLTREDGQPVDLAGVSSIELMPGLLTTIKSTSPAHLAIALLMLFAGGMVAVYRWHLLLKAVDLGIPFSRTFSLTFIGTFFNNVMPGLTGGDLVKAYYIARDHSNRKTEAIITVLLDRVLGLTGLAVVAAIVIPFDLERYGEVAPWIYGLLAAEVIFGCLFFSRRLRKGLGIDALLSKLPLQEFVTKIDQAVFLYRYRLRMLGVTLLLSMLVHVIIVSAIGVIGLGLGLDLSFQSYYAVIPIGLIASALPISPSGIGIGEATLVYFLGTVGVTVSGALSLAFLYRFAQLCISLIGGICLARLKDRVSAEEMERFAEQEGGDVGVGSDDDSPESPSPAASQTQP